MILRNPDSDDQRLIVADYMDRTGDPARAEFIRGQIICQRLGPAPKRFTGIEQFDFRDKRGTVTLPERVQVGNRIDVELVRETTAASDYYPLKKKLKRKWYGLLVTSVRWIAPPSTMSVSFYVDDQSVCWPGYAWHVRERNLLREHGARWSGLPITESVNADHPGDTNGIIAKVNNSRVDLVFHRGFLDYMGCIYTVWRSHRATVMSLHPLRRLEFWDRTPYNSGGLFNWVVQKHSVREEAFEEDHSLIAMDVGRDMSDVFATAAEARSALVQRELELAREMFHGSPRVQEEVAEPVVGGT